MLGLPFTYGRHEVASGGLDAFVAGLGPDWRGLSLTMPLKRDVLPMLDRTTPPLVDELGVANTVAFRQEATGSSAGANTDVEGIVRPVEALGHLPGEATIVGGGATAASALAAAVRLGAVDVRLFLRDTAKAGSLVELAVRLGDARVLPVDSLPGTRTGSSSRRCPVVRRTRSSSCPRGRTPCSSTSPTSRGRPRRPDAGRRQAAGC